MNNQAALTRALLVAIPVAVFAAIGIGLPLVGLAVLVIGIAVLVARRRSLPDALMGDRRGRWWV